MLKWVKKFIEFHSRYFMENRYSYLKGVRLFRLIIAGLGHAVDGTGLTLGCKNLKKAHIFKHSLINEALRLSAQIHGAHRSIDH